MPDPQGTDHSRSPDQAYEGRVIAVVAGHDQYRPACGPVSAGRDPSMALSALVPGSSSQCLHGPSGYPNAPLA